ncbi:MAG: hypothetical protein ACOX6O_04905 [Christensenellales bacterium]|jgi:hypothetical protein
MDEQEHRETELKRREAAIEQRERAIRAREALAEAGLPQGLAEHLDYSSDEALDKGLALAREARRLAGAAALGAPKAAGARMDGRADYEKRALLYLTDRNDYLEQYKGGEK